MLSTFRTSFKFSPIQYISAIVRYFLSLLLPHAMHGKMSGLATGSFQTSKILNQIEIENIMSNAEVSRDTSLCCVSEGGWRPESPESFDVEFVFRECLERCFFLETRQRVVDSVNCRCPTQREERVIHAAVCLSQNMSTYFSMYMTYHRLQFYNKMEKAYGRCILTEAVKRNALLDFYRAKTRERLQCYLERYRWLSERGKNLFLAENCPLRNVLIECLLLTLQLMTSFRRRLSPMRLGEGHAAFLREWEARFLPLDPPISLDEAMAEWMRVLEVTDIPRMLREACLITNPFRRRKRCLQKSLRDTGKSRARTRRERHA